MTIAILDFGGQYTHLLAQRIRKLHVHSVIIPPTTENLTLYDGIILSGGPHSVNDISAPKYNPNLFNVEVPILGICYGFQLLCKHFGCEIIRGQTTEYGRCSMNVCSGNLFQNVQSSEVWMSHTDTVTTLTDDLLVTAKTDDCIAGVQHVSKKIFGVQFHPEVRHTTCGDLILTNFIKMCHVTTTWNPKNQLKRIIKDIKRVDKNVIVLLSGGVDSAVTFALLNRALGVERVIGLHINNGFMRHKESESVMQVLSELKMSNVVCVDASDDFCKALKGVIDPQKKRQIIGNLFIDTQQKKVTQLELDSSWILGQGTIYPDTVESGTETAQVIKTHHNRVDRIQEMIARGKVIEPIAELYKDEVREIGTLLGLPDSLIYRHPFPGPGLAIRLLCSDGIAPNMKKIQQDVDTFLLGSPFRGYVLPIKSVGVQGDARTYAHPVMLVGDSDWDTIDYYSTRLIGKIAEVNRVVWALEWNGDPSKIRLQASSVTFKRLQTLRKIDNHVTEYLRRHKLYNTVWQCPVVMIPCGLYRGSESIVLRPVDSQEAMTANFSRIDLKLLAKELLSTGISTVLYDVTNKPPGTIEWE